MATKSTKNLKDNIMQVFKRLYSYYCSFKKYNFCMGGNARIGGDRWKNRVKTRKTVILQGNQGKFFPGRIETSLYTFLA